MTAIGLVMVLYVAIAFAVFGNLSTEAIIAAKDFALAKSALPIFGQIGFTVVAVTALIATASAINANLYAVTNVTYQMAKDGELPAIFGKPIAHSREGLVISAVLIIILTLLFNLTEIAIVGSISILFIHAVTHIGHLKIIAKTGASRWAVSFAALLSLLAMILALIYVNQTSSQAIQILVGFVIVAAITEIALQKITKRVIKPRTR